MEAEHLKVSKAKEKELFDFMKETKNKEEYRRASAVKQKVEGLQYRTIAKKDISYLTLRKGEWASKKGDYIEEKWIRKKKQFIKLHIAADAKSKKVVSFRITRGNVHDAKTFCPLVRESFKKYNIHKVCADKAQGNFNLLERLDVEPVIAIRNNASTRERRCPLRREEILLIRKLGYRGWKRCK